MLNFKNTLIAFLLITLVLLFTKASIYWVVLVFFIFDAILFWGSYFIHSNFYLKAYCKGSNAKKQIAISFDDGVHQNTTKILSILKENNTLATFFVIGKNIENQEMILQQMDREGHIIGNHSYSHSYFFDFYFSSKIKRELQQTQALIEHAIHKKSIWFRPPYGVTTPHIAKAVRQLNYATIGWNIRSLDTVTYDDTTLLTRLKKQLKPGAIVLFHDSCSITVNTLTAFIHYVKNEGYEIVGMDQLLNLQPYA